MRSQLLQNRNRIVVKLGTGVLTDSRKQPDLAQLEQLVGQVAEQRRAGREIVLVTSGAVGAGMGALGYKKRPGALAELQACAAVGQSRLMATYEELFVKHDLHVAQVLLDARGSAGPRPSSQRPQHAGNASQARRGAHHQ